MNEEFSKEILDALFCCDKDGRLITTETYDVEYKVNFNIDADILKTMNGLANNRGGYILFGVEPINRELEGLNESKINYYKNNIDSEATRGRILASCQPNMEYKHYLHKIGDKKFIVIFVPESKNKPHIFSISISNEIKPGDIFYRYNDSIKKIQFAELSAIIENKREREQAKWMKFLGEIAKIGLDNALVIDAKNGKLITADNYQNGIVLDESVLSKFKLIKEGQFNEVSGDPTLKIVGTLALTTDTGQYELTSTISEIMNPNKTHPYRAVDIFNKLVEDRVKTKDWKLLTDGKVTYHRVVYYIKNNNLDIGIENVFIQEATAQKTYSLSVYSKVKDGFENMTLTEIETLKLNNVNKYPLEKS